MPFVSTQHQLEYYQLIWGWHSCCPAPLHFEYKDCNEERVFWEWWLQIPYNDKFIVIIICIMNATMNYMNALLLFSLQFLLSTFKAVSKEIYWLHFSNRILLYRNLLWFKWFHWWFVWDTVLHLKKAVDQNKSACITYKDKMGTTIEQYCKVQPVKPAAVTKWATKS